MTTPEQERADMIRRAVTAWQAELDRTAPAIAAALSSDEPSGDEPSDEPTATAFADCCWCIPVTLTKTNVCTTCGHQWKEEK